MESPVYFPTPDAFRKWLEENHDKATELWVGYFKKGTGEPTMTWPESVDEALCFGWIDGLRKSVDERRYKIRFSPRRPNSIWSAVNIRKMEALIEAGRMRPPGMAAYERRKAHKSEVYAYEQEKPTLSEPFEKQLRADAKAWAFFQTLSPYIQKASVWYVMRAKRETTRQKRLQILIDSCREGLKIPPLRR